MRDGINDGRSVGGRLGGSKERELGASRKPDELCSKGEALGVESEEEVGAQELAIEP